MTGWSSSPEHDHPCHLNSDFRKGKLTGSTGPVPSRPLIFVRRMGDLCCYLYPRDRLVAKLGPPSCPSVARPLGTLGSTVDKHPACDKDGRLVALGY